MPYRARVYWSNEDDCYIAEAMDLEHCAAHGDSPDDALSELRIAMHGWLESCRKWGDPIPPETPVEDVFPSSESNCIYLTPTASTARKGATWDVP